MLLKTASFIGHVVTCNNLSMLQLGTALTLHERNTGTKADQDGTSSTHSHLQ